MCLKELLEELARQNVFASESQIRWAIKTGKVTRPRLDGSHRFDFSADNACELALHFGQSEEPAGNTSRSLAVAESAR